MTEFEQIKAMIRNHCTKFSRFRVMVLITIASVFVWVLMGARDHE